MTIKLEIKYDYLHKPEKTREDDKSVWYRAWSSIRGTLLKLIVTPAFPTIVRIDQYYWSWGERKWKLKGSKDVLCIGSTETYTPKPCSAFCPPKPQGAGTYHSGWYAFVAYTPPTGPIVIDRSKDLLLEVYCVEPECGHTDCTEEECEDPRACE